MRQVFFQHSNRQSTVRSQARGGEPRLAAGGGTLLPQILSLQRLLPINLGVVCFSLIPYTHCYVLSLPAPRSLLCLFAVLSVTLAFRVSLLLMFLFQEEDTPLYQMLRPRLQSSH